MQGWGMMNCVSVCVHKIVCPHRSREMMKTLHPNCVSACVYKIVFSQGRGNDETLHPNCVSMYLRWADPGCGPCV